METKVETKADNSLNGNISIADIVDTLSQRRFKIPELVVQLTTEEDAKQEWLQDLLCTMDGRYRYQSKNDSNLFKLIDRWANKTTYFKVTPEIQQKLADLDAETARKFAIRLHIESLVKQGAQPVELPENTVDEWERDKCYPKSFDSYWQNKVNRSLYRLMNSKNNTVVYYISHTTPEHAV